jgi:UDP-glucose 4-epimerase
LDVVSEAKQIAQHPIPIEFVGRRPGDTAKLIASFEMATDVLKWTPLQSDLKHILGTMWGMLHPNRNSSNPELI